MRISSLLKPFTNLKLDSFKELSEQRFGIPEDDETDWDHYQFVVSKFFDGLYYAVDIWNQDSLMREIDKEPIEYRGFVYEGAGMGLVFLDSLLPYKNRFESFRRMVGPQYELLLQIGAGMAFGYLGEGMPVRIIRRDTNKFVDRQDPMQRWLVLDGYGFFDGMVNWQKVITRQKRPGNFSGYSLRAYDQGVGRSLWICTGGGVSRFGQAIGSFTKERQADLWGGIGEGCAYAGGVDDFGRIRNLAAVAGEYAGHFATGVAVGAVGRVRAGEKAAHTDLACEAVWECDSEMVVKTADDLSDALAGTVDDSDLYETWRASVRKTWTAEHDHLTELRSS